MEHEHNDEDGGSPSCSDVGQTLAVAAAVRKIMEKELEPMVISIVRRVIPPMVTTTVQKEIVPVAEDLVRRVVKEVFQPVEEKLLNGGTRNEMPNDRTFKLNFSDEVSDAVTGGALEGINDKCLKLALLDSNGADVTSGDAASAEVEILLLDNGNNHEGSATPENFVSSIIPAGEKKKPHFANRVCISLKNGVGELTGLKLGNGPWIKSCHCRLGARIAQNLGGITVQDGWTSPFKVVDFRDALYDKHHPPSLKSEVWRLDEIGKNGEPCKRLGKKEIKIVQDFLFWLNVKPEELKRILLGTSRGDSKWNTTVAHARTCKTDDDKKMYSHEFSTEPHMRVVYDVVGKLKGEIVDYHFVPIDEMFPDRKVRARELLGSLLEDASAFGERYDASFSDEDSLLKEFPYRSSVHASTNSSLQGSSSQSTVGPNNLCSSAPPASLGPGETEELSNPASAPFMDLLISGGGSLADLDYDKHESPFSFGEFSELLNVNKDDEIFGRFGGNKPSYVEDFNALGLRFENHYSSPTSMLSADEACVNWGRDVRPISDMQHSSNGLGGGGSNRMVGESSSGHSNASFHSAMSVTENRGWFDEEYCCPAPPSPDPMLHYIDDTSSYTDRACGDEGCASEPRVVDPPNGLKKLSRRLWNSFRKRMLMDVGRSNKKRRVD